MPPVGEKLQLFAALDLGHGPVRAGQEIAVTLVLPGESIVLTGRAVDVEREPLAEARLHFHFTSGRGRGTLSTTTDAGGYFGILLDRSYVGAVVSRARLEYRQDDFSPGIAGSLQLVDPLQVGERQLGDIVLAPAPVVLTGYITEDGEPAVDPPSLTLEGLETQATVSGDEVWRTEPALHVEYGGDGGFIVRGDARRTRYRLRVQSARHLPVEPMEFSVGTEDLHVQLVSGGSARALVITGETGDWPVFLYLVPTGGQVPDSEDPRRRLDPETGGLRGRESASQQGRILFHWIGLYPGVYSLEVRPFGATRPIMSIADLRIPAGRAVEDQRLDAIDLRGRLREIVVTLADTTGSPLPASSPGAVMLADDAGKGLKGFSIDAGTATIVTAERDLDLLVMVRGYRPKEMFGVDSDTTVLLDPYPSVEMRLAGGLPVLPVGARIRLSVRPSSPTQLDERSYVTIRGRGRLRDLMASDKTSGFVDSNGEVILRTLRDGLHIVEAIVHLGDGPRSQRISNVFPQQVQVPADRGQSVFSIRISSGDLARAIEMARRDRK